MIAGSLDFLSVQILMSDNCYFMSVGHETSSGHTSQYSCKITTDIFLTTGTLSFLTYYLLKHPNVMRKLRDEIEEVIGTEQPQYEHLSKLPYLTGEIVNSSKSHGVDKTF